MQLNLSHKMFSKAQQTMATIYLILLLPVFVICIPTSFEEETDTVPRGIIQQTQKVFKNLHTVGASDSGNSTFNGTEDPECNHVPVENTCTLVEHKKWCCSIHSITSLAAYMCRTWESTCGKNLCPTRLYYTFLSEAEAKMLKNRKSELRDIMSK